jgi:hypothetical protein
VGVPCAALLALQDTDVLEVREETSDTFQEHIDVPHHPCPVGYVLSIGEGKEGVQALVLREPADMSACAAR